MNQETQQELLLKNANEVLHWIGEKVKSAEAVVSEQIPGVAAQYILYGQVTSVFSLFAFIAVFAVAAFYVLPKGYKLNKADKYSATGPMMMIAGVVGSLASFPVMMLAFRDVFLVWFAPKVWLLKEIATLLK